MTIEEARILIKDLSEKKNISKAERESFLKALQVLANHGLKGI